MRRWIAGVAATIAFGAGHAHADCKSQLVLDLHLRPNPVRALVEAQVNGHPVTFIADTGAAISTIPFVEAEPLGIKRTDTVEMESEGVGGKTQAGEGTFRLQLGSYTFPHESMVLQAMGHLDHGAVGFLGRDLLSQYDLEIDLPDNAMRVMQNTGCQAEQLVYWNRPFSEVPLENDGTQRPPILFMVKLNGHMVPAMLDSGAPVSTVTRQAADAAGAHVEEGSERMHGTGLYSVEADHAVFDTFSIGDEMVSHVKLQVSDMWKYGREEQIGSLLGGKRERADSPRVLLGADFLRSHRVLASRATGTMVFSYMGGPIFGPPLTQQASQAAPSSGQTPQVPH